MVIVQEQCLPQMERTVYGLQELLTITEENRRRIIRVILSGELK